MEEGELLNQRAPKKFRGPGENRTHDPRSSRPSALTTELQGALWRVGSKFNHNYTSHRGLYRVPEGATYPIALPHFVSNHQNEAHLNWKNKQSSAVHHAMLAWDYEQISRHYMASFSSTKEIKYRVMI